MKRRMPAPLPPPPPHPPPPAAAQSGCGVDPSILVLETNLAKESRTGSSRTIHSHTHKSNSSRTYCDETPPVDEHSSEHHACRLVEGPTNALYSDTFLRQRQPTFTAFGWVHDLIDTWNGARSGHSPRRYRVSSSSIGHVCAHTRTRCVSMDGMNASISL